ncbi:MAG: hypothetical protein M1833_005939 [Piccolia ochrophora]|nr:MAG: hypothetical protein M1833_005939 [Piccolia ochrophora]
MAAAESPSRPSKLTGGCLCSSVRYEIDLSEGRNWPPAPNTCQCTQCRKWTGALVPSLLELNPSQITWAKPTAPNPFREFNSSPGCYRGFCSNCGSSLTWRSEAEKDTIELCTGSIDEELLIGHKTGNGVERTGGWGKELGTPTRGNVWYQNVIRGVTDGRITAGKKMVEASDFGETME